MTKFVFSLLYHVLYIELKRFEFLTTYLMYTPHYILFSPMTNERKSSWLYGLISILRYNYIISEPYILLYSTIDFNTTRLHIFIFIYISVADPEVVQGWGEGFS